MKPSPEYQAMSYASPKEFVDYYEKIRSRTVRVIERIPRNRIDWTCKDGKFTFADLIRHIAATERLMFAECGVARASDGSYFFTQLYVSYPRP